MPHMREAHSRNKDGNLKEFCNRICRDIPDGWSLALHLENGSGDFTLNDPYGKDINYEEYTNVDCPLIERGIAALEYAMRIEREARVK